MKTLKRNERRRPVQKAPGCYYVDPQRFCQLAVSNRQLIRADDPHAGLRGLIDQETGTKYVVESQRLASFQVTQS